MSNSSTILDAGHHLHPNTELRRRLGTVYRIILANTAQTESQQPVVASTKEQKDGDVKVSDDKE